MKELIGRGSFAYVYKAVHVTTGINVAIKIIQKSLIKSQRQLTNIAREIMLHRQLDHPLIAQLFYTFEDNQNIYLVMEYSSRGEIRDYITSKGELSENEAKRLFVQLFSVIEYLHKEKKIVHRDVKAENVLIDDNYNIRLVDFGLSRNFENEEETFTSQCGSYQYISPEMIAGEKYTCECDIWSMGVLLYIMVCGIYPFEGETMQKTMELVLSQEPEYPTYLSTCLVDLLRSMLCKDPTKRIKIDDIKKHSWFSSTEYARIEASRKSFGKYDPDIEKRMHDMCINTTSLRRNLTLGVCDNETCIYKMMKREKEADEMIRCSMHSSASMIIELPEKCCDKRVHRHKHHHHRTRSDGSADESESHYVKPIVHVRSHRKLSRDSCSRK